MGLFVEAGGSAPDGVELPGMVAPLRSRSHENGPESSHVTPNQQSDGGPRVVESPAKAIQAAPSDVKVLLVDDKEQNLVALSAVLDQPGLTVVCAQSGKQALRHVLDV